MVEHAEVDFFPHSWNQVLELHCTRVSFPLRDKGMQKVLFCIEKSELLKGKGEVQSSYHLMKV